MGKRELFKVVIAQPAKVRYQLHILPYLYTNYSFERALMIDQKIIEKAGTLSNKPERGRKEDFLIELNGLFRFIIYKETKHFEIKIIYYVDHQKSTVYVTDFFPTKMSPLRIIDNH